MPETITAEKVFITCAWFKAYNRDMATFFMDKEKPMRHVITRRLRDICHTMKLKDIKTFDATEI